MSGEKFAAGVAHLAFASGMLKVDRRMGNLGGMQTEDPAVVAISNTARREVFCVKSKERLRTRGRRSNVRLLSRCRVAARRRGVVRRRVRRALVVAARRGRGGVTRLVARRAARGRAVRRRAIRRRAVGRRVHASAGGRASRTVRVIPVARRRGCSACGTVRSLRVSTLRECCRRAQRTCCDQRHCDSSDVHRCFLRSHAADQETCHPSPATRFEKAQCLSARAVCYAKSSGWERRSRRHGATPRRVHHLPMRR